MSRLVRSCRFGLGFLSAIALLAAMAEAFLRQFPPTELHPYLGDASPLVGPMVADEQLGVHYRSWQDLAETNQEALTRFGSLAPTSADPRPIWAMFGNSFVQAPGMLADTARTRVPSRRIFNLGRNEPYFVRIAQIRTLLAAGLRPERILVVLLPLDTFAIAQQPLDTIRVSPGGAMISEPRHPPGVFANLTRQSRLCFAAWCRAGRHRSQPGLRPRHLNHAIPQSVIPDLTHSLTLLRGEVRSHGAELTVVLIPNYEQVTGSVPCTWQEALVPALRGTGLDVCDTKSAFVGRPDAPDLFIPDKHFNDVGNQLLLQTILNHIRQSPGSPTMARLSNPDARCP